MSLDIILVVIIGVCLAAVVFIVIKKIPRLFVLDIDTVPEARAAKVRDMIIEERLRRQAKRSKELLKNVFSPLFSLLLGSFRKLFKRVYELERRYQAEAKKIALPSTRIEMEHRVRMLLAEADKMGKTENYGEAERKYIEAVSIDPKSVAAYRGLLKIYSERKEYDEAIQTGQFIIKLGVGAKEKRLIQPGNVTAAMKNLELVGDYLVLGDIYQTVEKYGEALKNFKKALELEPNNPRNIVKVLDVCLILKDKALAEKMLTQLEAVNPENQKLSDYRERMGEII